MGLFGDSIEIKTPEQIDAMRRAGLVVGETLALLRDSVRPGMTTRDLDGIAAESIRSKGATPSFLGYQGFPAVICASPNEVIVHGIPNDRVLNEGDIVSIDCGAIVEGWHGDSAITVAVGATTPENERLMDVTRESMWRGIAAARLGGRIGDISYAIESYIRTQGRYGVVEEFVGHGIGSEMHMEPNVPNFGKRGKGPKIVEGMALAIEPMVTLGTKRNTTLEDDWTVVTDDDSWSAHFEHTITVTETGVWVLTALDGGKADLERLGVPFGGR